MIQPPQNEHEYLNGRENKAIRYYFYSLRGMDFINSFRNLVLLIFAAYFSLKLESLWWIVGMFAVSVPLLIIFGWYSVHRMNKITDWLSIKFGTFYAVRQFSIYEEMLEELKKLNEKIDVLNTNNKGL